MAKEEYKLDGEVKFYAEYYKELKEIQENYKVNNELLIAKLCSEIENKFGEKRL